MRKGMAHTMVSATLALGLTTWRSEFQVSKIGNKYILLKVLGELEFVDLSLSSLDTLLNYIQDLSYMMSVGTEECIGILLRLNQGVVLTFPEDSIPTSNNICNDNHNPRLIVTENNICFIYRLS